MKIPYKKQQLTKNWGKQMSDLVWHIEKRHISDLKPHEKNPRIITNKGIDQLKESFEEIGAAQPINIDTDNTILSGHARHIVERELDPNREIDVYVPNRPLTEEEREAVLIRMNKNVAGVWDFDILANDFEVSQLLDFGFTDAELKIDTPLEKPEKDVDPLDFEGSKTCPKCGFEYD